MQAHPGRGADAGKNSHRLMWKQPCREVQQMRPLQGCPMRGKPNAQYH